MELESIKDLWQKDLAETPEISLEKQREIRMPLEMIRDNLKSLIIRTSIGMFFLIFMLNNLEILSGNDRFFWLIFLAVYLVVVIYYFVKFQKLQKKLSQNVQMTKEYLQELRVDIKLMIENLKSYYVATIPLLLAELFLFIPKLKFVYPKIIYLSIFAVIIAAFIILRMTHYLKKNYIQYEKKIDELFKGIN